MRIRLEGTDADIRAAVARLRELFVVADVSRPYRSRRRGCRVDVEVYHSTGARPYAGAAKTEAARGWGS